jgi:hypothetical protein
MEYAKLVALEKIHDVWTSQTFATVTARSRIREWPGNASLASHDFGANYFNAVRIRYFERSLAIPWKDQPVMNSVNENGTEETRRRNQHFQICTNVIKLGSKTLQIC